MRNGSRNSGGSVKLMVMGLVISLSGCATMTTQEKWALGIGIVGTSIALSQDSGGPPEQNGGCYHVGPEGQIERRLC